MIAFKNILREDFNFTGEFISDENGNPVVFYHGSDQMNIQSFDFKESARLNGFFGQIYKVKSGAIFFALEKEKAQIYAKDRAKLNNSQNFRIYKVNLKVKTPLDLRQITSEILDILMEAGFNAWEEYGVKDNSGFMYSETIREWEKNGREVDPNYTIENDPLFEEKWYYNIDNLRADPSQFWSVADNQQVVENLKRFGYDGLLCIEDNGGISVAVFNPNQIQIIK